MTLPLTRTIGIWNLENFSTALPSFATAIFTRPTTEGGLGWSMEETEVLMAGVRNDMRNTNIHSYFRMYVGMAIPSLKKVKS